MIFYLRINNQNVQELDPESFSLAEKNLDVFTTFVSYKLDNKLGLLRPDLHIQRVINGAKLLNINSPLENLDLLKSHLKKLLNKNIRQKIRIIQRSTGALELQIEPYLPLWEEGSAIALKSFNAMRPSPEIKHTNFSVSSAARFSAEQSDAQEGLLVSPTSEVLEGAWSNVYWVDRNNKIQTTKLNVLPGITRQIISELADIHFGSISLDELKNTEEVFISQSTTGITAVNKIDSSKIKIGETTKLIANKFESYISENLTAIEDL